MFLNRLFVIFIAIIVSGCGDPHGKFVGQWEKVSKSGNAVLEITNDGDTYLLNQNILNEGSKPIVLTKTSDAFTLQGFALGLAANGEELMVADSTYKKASPDRVKEMKDKKNKEDEARKQAFLDFENKLNANKDECQKLKDEFSQKDKELKAASDNEKMMMDAELKKMNEDYQLDLKKSPSQMAEISKAFAKKSDDFKKRSTDKYTQQQKQKDDLRKDYDAKAKNISGCGISLFPF